MPFDNPDWGRRACLKARATDLDKKYCLADEIQKALTLPTVPGKWTAHKTEDGFTAQPFFNQGAHRKRHGRIIVFFQMGLRSVAPTVAIVLNGRAKVRTAF